MIHTISYQANMDDPFKKPVASLAIKKFTP